jgi:hypothetical protein
MVGTKEAVFYKTDEPKNTINSSETKLGFDLSYYQIVPSKINTFVFF